MNVLKKAALFCALLLSLPAVAQVVASGTKVQDGTGTGALLSSGTWNFGSTNLTVTAGAFSGTVTPGTQTVTVVNASSVTVLTVPGVVISSAFSWDTFIVSGGASISGTGAPTIACQVGAVYTQTDSTPANTSWTCYNVNGQGVWQRTNTPPTPSNVANAVASEIIVTPSATPSFGNLANSSATILTANITSWSISNGIPGQTTHVTFCENGTGGYTLSGTPANVLNWPGLASTSANACTTVPLVWSSTRLAWISAAGTGGGGGGGSAGTPLQMGNGSGGFSNSNNTENNNTLVNTDPNGVSAPQVTATGSGSPAVVNFSIPNNLSTGTVANTLSTFDGSGNLIEATSSQTAVPLFPTLASYGQAGTTNCSADGRGYHFLQFPCQSQHSGRPRWMVVLKRGLCTAWSRPAGVRHQGTGRSVAIRSKDARRSPFGSGKHPFLTVALGGADHRQPCQIP
jgi:hypothetical protein